MAPQASKSKAIRYKQPTARIPTLSSEEPDKLTAKRPLRAHLSTDETRSRMETFASEREEAFIAAIRKDQD